jgi:P2 family phage contractile tail tube protein
MMPKVTRDFHLMADGRSYIGLIQSFEAPKLQKKTEDILNGGMIGAVEIDMHLEKLECSWTANEHNAQMLALFGMVDQQGVMLRVRLAVENCAPGAAAEPVEYVLRGIVKEIDDGSAEVGKKSEIKYSMGLSYYKKVVNNVPVLEVDFINYVYRVNGVDLYAARRAALGI